MKAKRLIDIKSKTDAQLREFVYEALKNSNGRGFTNIINAEANAELKAYILDSTSFLDGPGMDYINLQTRLFAFANGMTSANQLPHCAACGKLIRKNVIAAKAGFKYKTCSAKCNAARPEWAAKRRATKLRLHGDENWNNAEKRKNTCMEKYGHATNMATEEFAKASKATRLERYGDENFVNPEKTARTKLERYPNNEIGKAISAGKASRAAADPEYYAKQKIKRQKTKRRLYGDPAWNNSEKARKTFAERARTDATFLESRREKAAATCLARYGKRSYSATRECRDRVINTSLEKYGTGNYAKTEQCKDRIRKTSIERYGVRNYFMTEESKRRTSERINAETYKRMTECADVAPAFTYEEYVANKRAALPWKCRKCGSAFSSPVNSYYLYAAGSYARCLKCDPPARGTSKKEREMQEFIEKLDPLSARNDRRAIKPLELDSYSESARAGFEFDGLFWHSSLMTDDLERPARKTDMCGRKGIRLFHVFEDEWDERRAQVEKTIAKCFTPKAELGKACAVREISETRLRRFEKANSPLLFQKTGKNRIGLFDGKTMVAAMSYNVNAKICTIVSFTENADINAGGCFGALLGYVEKRHALIRATYRRDARYPILEERLAGGMALTRISNPSAWLLDRRLRRVWKIYSKKDVEKALKTRIEPGEPAMKTLHERGYAVIYDCGNAVYEKRYG